MPVNARKSRKMRGSKTHGWGSKKKHRGKGSKGGKGNAGWLKHKRSFMLANDPDHFGRVGFKPVGKRMTSISLRNIDILARKLGKTEIDVRDFGYNKVLSNGRLTQKLTIKADSFAESAKEKIIKMGSTPVEEKAE